MPEPFAQCQSGLAAFVGELSGLTVKAQCEVSLWELVGYLPDGVELSIRPRSNDRAVIYAKGLQPSSVLQSVPVLPIRRGHDDTSQPFRSIAVRPMRRETGILESRGYGTAFAMSK